jgi:hypothetical protein
MVADVSAVADPNTGVNVYDSNCNFINQLLGNCFSGWGIVGGTSVGSPLTASVYALAGSSTFASKASPSLPYAAFTSNAGALNDVTSGSNGSCSGSPAYYCSAATGYDGPTGLGTPNGIGAF